jgi:hypothetical protein
MRHASADASAQEVKTRYRAGVRGPRVRRVVLRHSAPDGPCDVCRSPLLDLVAEVEHG